MKVKDVYCVLYWCRKQDFNLDLRAHLFVPYVKWHSASKARSRDEHRSQTMLHFCGVAIHPWRDEKLLESLSGILVRLVTFCSSDLKFSIEAEVPSSRRQRKVLEKSTTWFIEVLEVPYVPGISPRFSLVSK